MAGGGGVWSAHLREARGVLGDMDRLESLIALILLNLLRISNLVNAGLPRSDGLHGIFGERRALSRSQHLALVSLTLCAVTFFSLH